MDSFDSAVTRPGLRLADIENYVDTLRGNDLFQGRYFVSATSGTTGTRGIFLWNFREWVQVVASYNRGFDWAGSTAGLAHRVKTAVVSSTNPTGGALSGSRVRGHTAALETVERSGGQGVRRLVPDTVDLIWSVVFMVCGYNRPLEKADPLPSVKDDWSCRDRADLPQVSGRWSQA
jgi:hypothetical protein